RRRRTAYDSARRDRRLSYRPAAGGAVLNGRNLRRTETVAAYTDQEEIERLKAWWKDYGGSLLIGVVIGLVLLFGNKYWTQYKEERRAAASELYTQLQTQMQESKADVARVSAGKLIEDYASTPYAGLAALALARLDVDA